MISVGISFREVVENSDPSTVFGRENFGNSVPSGNIDEIVNAISRVKKFF